MWIANWPPYFFDFLCISAHGTHSINKIYFWTIRRSFLLLSTQLPIVFDSLIIDRYQHGLSTHICFIKITAKKKTDRWRFIQTNYCVERNVSSYRRTHRYGYKHGNGCNKANFSSFYFLTVWHFGSRPIFVVCVCFFFLA